MILALMVILVSNNAFAQTVHDRTLYEIVKQTSTVNEGPQIYVGNSPGDIVASTFFSLDMNRIYVANYDSDTVSVISVENDTKIKDIPVGNAPSFVDFFRGKVYVANFGSDTVSVISTENDTKIKDIPVGKSPSDIDYYLEDIDIAHLLAIRKLYVANYDSDTVSVISVENDTKIKDIPVGTNPGDIAVAEPEVFGSPEEKDKKVYVANFWSDTVSVISTENDTKIKDIPVGIGPTGIAIDESLSKAYVVNRGTFNSASGTVSVISTENDTKIKDIPVGKGPTGIALGSFSKAYVANYDSDTVSVISVENDTKKGEDIPVGTNPEDIAIDEKNKKVYVANFGSDTVSVISVENDTKKGEDIPVGKGPTDIGIDEQTDTIYVANSGSDSISVIDGTANKVVAGVTFQVNPFNSGYIVCDDLTAPSPIGEYVYVYSGARCTAKPNSGFEFSSWEENNLKDDSTQPITVSRPASNWDSFLEFFHLKSPDKSEATLNNIQEFGTFTANFKELPPAFPSEYLIPLYGIIISTIVGWSIPSIIGWARAKSDVRKLDYYHKQITSLYGDGKLDENDIEALDKLRSNIVDAYSKGSINEKHYESLKDEISVLYEEIFRKKIDSLNNNPSDDKIIQERLDQIRNEVEYAYSKGKINDKHYDLLNKDILDLKSKEKGDKY